MSAQVILTDLFNVTFSRDLVAGATPCALPDGPRIDLFGRAVAPANLLAQPVPGGGVTDERHLWPTWFNLIRECRPPVIFGEQVEAAINHGWLDLVQADLEGEGYACGAVGLPAGGVGAPHIRQRLWFVADTQSVGRSIQYTSHDGSANAPSRTLANANDSVADQRRSDIGELADANNSHQFGNRSGGGKRNKSENQRGWSNEQVDGCLSSSQLADAANNGHLAADGLRETVEPSGQAGAHGVGQSAGSCDVDQLADTAGAGRKERQHRPGEGGREIESGECEQQPSRHGATDQLADSQCKGLEGHAGDERNRNEPGRVNAQQARSVAPSSWSDCDWLPCRDGKARPVEPGTFPLAHGVSARLGRLRAYGNAIVPQVAQVFIEAYLET